MPRKRGRQIIFGIRSGKGNELKDKRQWSGDESDLLTMARSM